MRLLKEEIDKHFEKFKSIFYRDKDFRKIDFLKIN